MKLGRHSVNVLVVAALQWLINGALEDEPRPAGGAEGSRAEGADGSEGVGPMRQRGLGPVLGCPLRADVAARHKSVCRGSGVYIHCWLTAKPQGHVGTQAPAQRAFSAGCRALTVSLFLIPLRSLSPVVASMNMATGEVDPGLALFKADNTSTECQHFQFCIN